MSSVPGAGLASTGLSVPGAGLASTGLSVPGAALASTGLSVPGAALASTGLWCQEPLWHRLVFCADYEERIDLFR